ncbi:DUF1206 domain-containing protein [Microcella sp.]|uniref:DUF1206 domain-containing protein n=1 Tax=Microcella sp. TaxID=1913979 RepID=UPI003F71BAFD
MASARTTLPARLLSAARTVHESTGFERAARAGFAVNGLLHVLMGVLAISVATGAGNAGDDDDPAGAIHAIADTPGGFVLVWVIAAGLACLALWLLLESVLGHLVRGEVRSGLLVAAKAVAYGALAVPAVTIGLGGRVESDDDVREISAFLVQTPIGIVVLGLAGLAVIGIGVYFVVKGVRRTFLDDIRTPSGSVGKAVTVLGTVGYIAKGVALTAVGVLLIITAVTVDPAEAAGLDGALRSVAELPFGAALLVLIGLGLIAYGLYCGVRARRATL